MLCRRVDGVEVERTCITLNPGDLSVRLCRCVMYACVALYQLPETAPLMDTVGVSQLIHV